MALWVQFTLDGVRFRADSKITLLCPNSIFINHCIQLLLAPTVRLLKFKLEHLICTHVLSMELPPTGSTNQRTLKTVKLRKFYGLNSCMNGNKKVKMLGTFLKLSDMTLELQRYLCLRQRAV